MIDAIGIFGGTFDPVHYGHLRAALEAREKLGLKEMRLLPSGRPPHREEPSAEPEHRLAMLRLAVTHETGFVVDEREVRRSGRSFMVDTLEQIHADDGRKPLLLCVGQDAANALDSWHQWRRLFELAHLVVLRRPDSSSAYRGELAREMTARRVGSVEELLQSSAGRTLSLEITQLDISSTAIRAMFASGRSTRFLLPRVVVDYVLHHGLYGVTAL
jgi:nicotinate-nucleotide adenylyltransferase